MKNKKKNTRAKELYGSTVSMTKRFGWRLIKRDGPNCATCSKKLHLKHREFSVDHKIPVTKGGTNDLSNLQILCKKCNVAKADKIYGRPKHQGYNLMEQALQKAGITPTSFSDQSD